MPSRSHLSSSLYQHPQSSFLHDKMDPTSHPTTSQAPQTPDPRGLYSLRSSRPPLDLASLEPLHATFTALCACGSMVFDRGSAFQILSFQKQPETRLNDQQTARRFWRERSCEMDSLNYLCHHWTNETTDDTLRKFYEMLMSP